MEQPEIVCERCNGSHDVQEVYERSGWGRTRTAWFPHPTPLCRRCRVLKNGHWKYKDSFRRHPPCR